jgi:hypothetical protein
VKSGARHLRSCVAPFQGIRPLNGIDRTNRINREWPHQVAVPADQIMGKSHDIMHEFNRGLSLCSRGHTVHRGDIVYRVFCFADASHAERFCQRFSGERFDPKDRGRGSAWFLRGKAPD